MNLSSVLTIFRKEIRSYFVSPIAYVIATIFWALSGFFFVRIVASVVDYSLRVDASPFGGSQPFDASTVLLQQFLNLMGTLFLFISPILTMSLYAEERKRGTMELLATSPVTNITVALGKWLGALVFYITLLLPIMAYQVFIFASSTPAMNYRLFLAGHLGLILMAGAMLSFGMFISALTDNTIIAAIGTFGVMLLLWVIDAAAGQNSTGLDPVLRYVSILQQYGNWVQGSLTAGSVIFFVSMIALGLFLTVQAIEGLRWQRT
ncbi:MAG: ABC transporter permease subunit [Synechococcales cyanobacterium]